MGILKEETTYNEVDDKVLVTTTYDNADVLELTAAQRAEKVDGRQFKGNLAHVARIDMGDIQRLYNEGYNLLSPDPDEKRRALLYIQQNEPHLMTVNKKAFAKKRGIWV